MRDKHACFGKAVIQVFAQMAGKVEVLTGCIDDSDAYVRWATIDGLAQLVERNGALSGSELMAIAAVTAHMRRGCH